MSKTIWKTTMLVTDEQTVYLPEGAVPLTVQLQNNKPQLWFVADTDHYQEPRTVRCYGTGHPIAENLDNLQYLGTVQMQNGTLVFHFFIEKVVV